MQVSSAVPQNLGFTSWLELCFRPLVSLYLILLSIKEYTHLFYKIQLIVINKTKYSMISI